MRATTKTATAPTSVANQIPSLWDNGRVPAEVLLIAAGRRNPRLLPTRSNDGTLQHPAIVRGNDLPTLPTTGVQCNWHRKISIGTCRSICHSHSQLSSLTNKVIDCLNQSLTSKESKTRMGHRGSIHSFIHPSIHPPHTGRCCGKQ